MSHVGTGHDVIVVGGGITGCEAACMTARAGLNTLLVTTSLDTLYQLAHDSAALQPATGTLMHELLEELPASERGVPAADLRRAARRVLEALPQLHLLQSTAAGLVTEGGSVVGVTTWEGIDRRAPAVALCVGSFLRARLSVGTVVEHQGRLSEMAYDDLYLDLLARGFEFSDILLETPAVAGALPYKVSSVALAASEAGSDLRLARLAGLWAAGVCAPKTDPEPFSYESCARAGRALGESLARAASG